MRFSRISYVWAACLVPWALGLLGAIVSSAAEASVHASMLGDRSFMAHLLQPDALEIRLRAVDSALWVAVSAVVSYVAVQHVRSIDRMRLDQRRVTAASHRFAFHDSEARGRLSMRLHEGVAQDLTAARLLVTGIECASCEKAVTPVLSTVDTLLREALLQCRDIAQQISPQVLDEYGLIPALEVCGDRISESTGKRIIIEPLDSPHALDRSVLVMAFDVMKRTIRALADAPEVTSVSVSSEVEPGRLAVFIRWDGACVPEISIESHYAESVGASMVLAAGGRLIQLSLPAAAVS